MNSGYRVVQEDSEMMRVLVLRAQEVSVPLMAGMRCHDDRLRGQSRRVACAWNSLIIQH
jgi:hypothetical protein